MLFLIKIWIVDTTNILQNADYSNLIYIYFRNMCFMFISCKNLYELIKTEAKTVHDHLTDRYVVRLYKRQEASEVIEDEPALIKMQTCHLVTLLRGKFGELQLRFLVPVSGWGQRSQMWHVRVIPRIVKEHARRHHVHPALQCLVWGTKNEEAVSGRTVVTTLGRISWDWFLKRVRPRGSKDQKEYYKF